MENNYAAPNPEVPPEIPTESSTGNLARPLTPDEIDQRSLAWSPEPPFVSLGGADCRPGGSCGLDFNRETPRARWIHARYRQGREQKGLPGQP
jgi:hypothetical protein